MRRKLPSEHQRTARPPFDDSRDNAIEKLVALFVAGELAPGNFSEIIITHEDACRCRRGPGNCNCNPRFQIIRPWMVPRRLQ